MPEHAREGRVGGGEADPEIERASVEQVLMAITGRIGAGPVWGGGLGGYAGGSDEDQDDDCQSAHTELIGS